MVVSNGPSRGTNLPTVRARDWEVCTPPTRCSRRPGGCSQWLQESDFAVATTPEGGSPAKYSSSEDNSQTTDAAISIWSSIGRAEWNAGHVVRRNSRITREPHRTAAARGVRCPRGLARRKGSHCNPQIAQSTSRWFSACGREASEGSDRRSPSYPREEGEARLLRCHGHTLTVNAWTIHERSFSMRGCPDTEHNDRDCRRRIGNDCNQEDMDGTGSLKRREPPVIINYSFKWNTQGNCWINRDAWLCRYTSQNSLLFQQQREFAWWISNCVHSLGSEAKLWWVDAPVAYLYPWAWRVGSACKIQ